MAQLVWEIRWYFTILNQQELTVFLWSLYMWIKIRYSINLLLVIYQNIPNTDRKSISVISLHVNLCLWQAHLCSQFTIIMSRMTYHSFPNNRQIFLHSLLQINKEIPKKQIKRSWTWFLFPALWKTFSVWVAMYQNTNSFPGSTCFYCHTFQMFKMDRGL